MIKFCGHVAAVQLRKDKHFIQHQHRSSTRFHTVEPWPEIYDNRRVEQHSYDRGACHVRDAQTGRYLHSRATFTVSHPLLVQSFTELPSGDNNLWSIRHDHEPCFSVHEADLLIWGLEQLGSESNRTVYPVDKNQYAKAQPGTPTRGPDSRAVPPKTSSCKGCRNFRGRTNWDHSRVIGQCQYPHDEPYIPDCEGCLTYKGHDHQSHFEPSGARKRECMVDTKRSREYAPRSGKHPRDPARPASAADETTDLRGAPPGKRELGAEAEDRHSKQTDDCLLYTSPSPRDQRGSRMPSSA